ncbi:hypothetical protein [Paenarthrobacter sp. PH39-S1]|uniref:hypothetical protein n=1 Tax=Paenarthrobacter sp. PH39-S1 TaxID=3046204 RepID=UPI0024BB2385|nr:hypothetical protein [Paenarthrobacter sp. PH39-S1]MDJ0357608.1 hypothetical protein [Paenarthrobacter sp. PH39-S1]
MGINLSHAALRLVTGAFILNSGVGKLKLDDEHAAGLQSMAGKAIPALTKLPPERFGKMLSFGEITVGSLLLAPFVPSRLAGLALGVFSGSLVTMYLRTPGMTEPDGFRPTPAGTALAKDTWMLGIAAALLLDRKHKVVKVARRAAG